MAGIGQDDAVVGRVVDAHDESDKHAPARGLANLAVDEPQQIARVVHALAEAAHQA